MLTVVHQLTTTNFNQLANSAEFFLVEVDGSDPKNKLIGALASYFDAEYPQQFTFGKLVPQTITLDVWAKKHFPTTAFGIANGFYLFRRGKFEWSHSGYAPADEHDNLNLAIGFIGLLFDSSTAVAQSLDALAKKRINAVATALEVHLKKIETPKPARSTEKPSDPYSVLGLNRSASNNEVHQAFRKKMAANHPDRVEHLQNADFREFAEIQVRRIQAAYDAIKNERRLT